MNRSIATVSYASAWIAGISAALFLVALTALHFIQAGLNPLEHMISEYELGRSGWLMQGAFGLMALSCLAVLFASFPFIRTPLGWIGWGLLPLTVVGLTIAAFNVPDAIATASSDWTDHGRLHALGFALGVPSQTLAFLFLGLSLRRQPDWAPLKRPVLWVSQLPWIGFAGTGAGIVLASGGIWFGIPNRFYIVVCALWLILISYGLTRAGGDRTH